MASIVSIIPIVLLFILMLGFKMAGHKSALLTLVVTVLLALFAASPLGMIAPEHAEDSVIALTGWAVVEGILKAVFPILIIILMAIYSYNILVESKQIDVIKRQFTSITDDKGLLVLLLVWGFGDLLCMSAQLSFALYLSLFKNLLSKYSLFTINKWMFLWATVLIWPFTISHVMSIDFAHVPMSTWWETGYVVLFGTYLGYICMMIGQKTLRPTVVSVYNYVQPLVSVTVSVIVGLAVFKGMQAIAAILVFSGVWLVIKSKSKHDIDKHDHSLAYEKRHA